MLDFPNSLFVGQFLDVFVFSVAGGRGCLFDGARGLKTFTSKRSPQKPLAATSSLASSSVIAEAPESASPVIGCKVGSMHTSWYTSDISCCKISDLIVSYDGKSAHWARKGMLHREIGATGTRGGDKCWLPAISESNGISEGTFVEGETKFLQRQNSEPT